MMKVGCQAVAFKEFIKENPKKNLSPTKLYHPRDRDSNIRDIQLFAAKDKFAFYEKFAYNTDVIIKGYPLCGAGQKHALKCACVGLRPLNYTVRSL